MRDLLTNQLHIPWSLAVQHYLPAVTQHNVLWEPSANVVSVHQRGQHWVADWPDEESWPLPDSTIAWLMWHMEWWWTNALSGARGEGALPPSAVEWSGSVSASRSKLHSLHDDWVALVSTADLTQLCRTPMPTPQALSTVAAWVNVELMKNVAEVGQVLRAYDNRVA